MVFFKIRNKLKKIIKQEDFIPYKGLRKTDLLIFDDIFPHPYSGFRYEEFTVLLSSFRNSKIIMSATAYPIVGTPIREHRNHIKNFISEQNKTVNKLTSNKGYVNINTRLFYCVFINNIFTNIVWLERYKIPFIFTLYPGGGFQVEDGTSDEKLKKVLASPMFKKVIVTQAYTRDYLIKKRFCKSEGIEYIFGGVVPQNTISKELVDKKSYLINKSTFDICFCAAKYTDKGEDKGYDLFIDIAHKIAANYNFVRFHIIGGFSQNDIDVNLITDKIIFYGYKTFKELSSLYKNMDVLLSPNRPFILGKGAFDGFPLGTVVEASLNGVVCLVTDSLDQNKGTFHEDELVIIEANSNHIESKVISLIEDPEKLYSISRKARAKFMHIYSNAVQMNPRIELLKKILKH